MKKMVGEQDICQVKCFNKAKVGKLKKSALSQEQLIALTETFDVISDVTRLKILWALKSDELCVCDIAHLLNMSLSAISHQLRVLRNCGLIKYRSEGRMAFYSLKDNKVMGLINDVKQHGERK
ncbi:MAG: metalloregulator ArsR/SmtB family transcription factor [Elusimicrobiota bacterium]